MKDIFRKNKRGQNLAEYAVLIALIVGAAVAMQSYIKQGWSGRVQDVVDAPMAGLIVTVDGQTADLSGCQFNPYCVLSSAGCVESGVTYRENVDEYSEVTRTNYNERTIRENGAFETWNFA